METGVVRKWIGYAGQVVIVLVSIYLLYVVGRDLYLYDVLDDDKGTDDAARWVSQKEEAGWGSEDTFCFLLWGFYLSVTGAHLFLYFRKLSSMENFNMWALPAFDISRMKILSGILSGLFLSCVFFFHVTMPEVFTPGLTPGEYGNGTIIRYDLVHVANGIGGNWAIFTLITPIPLLLQGIIHKSRFIISEKKWMRIMEVIVITISVIAAYLFVILLLVHGLISYFSLW